MEDIFKLLVGADTVMVAVTVAVCQIIKRMLPSPPPEILGAPYNPWAIIRSMAWVPFAMSFVIGIILSMTLDPTPEEEMVGMIRNGLATGAYSVAAWELWSNAKKLFGG